VGLTGVGVSWFSLVCVCACVKSIGRIGLLPLTVCLFLSDSVSLYCTLSFILSSSLSVRLYLSQWVFCYLSSSSQSQSHSPSSFLITWDLAMLSAHYIQKGLLFTKPPAADEQEGFIYTLAFVGCCFVHRDGLIVRGILLNRDGPRHVGLHLGDLLVAQGVSTGVPAREFCELGPHDAVFSCQTRRIVGGKR
jgi:hypothetical protein